MSLLTVQSLKLAFGPKTIFEGASFTVGPHDRCGLVGPNGTGKSTLLKIITGQVQPDDGTVTIRKRARIGYLPQELADLPTGPLVDMVLNAVPGKEALDERLSSTETQLAQSTQEADQMELAQLLADLHAERDHFEERFGRHRAESILAGLGFSEADFVRDTNTLSGGWRMRAALASLLLQDPDLLLLDEPTNHLDLPTVAWFDAFLKRFNKAFILICHDRGFLDSQIDHVIGLEVDGVKTYPGKFDAYQAKRAEEYEQLLAQAARQQQRREQMQEFVNRFRAKASKARQVQSRIKMLEKDEIVQIAQERDTVSFRFPTVAASGREVATFKGVKKAFGEKVVYQDLDATLLRGERVAVVGVNGAGKTTLLKLLAGELKTDEGSVTLGHNVSLGYYAQHHADTLDKSSTILDEIWSLAPDKAQSWVRGVLGSFLFSGDDVDKKIGVLSGGERARVALARLLVKPANLLVMDEPTNHLDLDSSEALIEALDGYEGTLIFVSHNRSFLDRLATKVWDVRDRKVVPWGGNLSDYMHHLSLQAEGKQASGEAASAAGPVNSRKEQRRAEAEARQAKSVKTGPLKKEVATLEARIATLETEQKQREQQLADPAFAADFAASRPVIEAHKAAAEELEQSYARWEIVSQELAALG
ncbi:MAG: ABC-F family ATP-binding cassette domain-containing protein [Myxococcaceae bacterium]